MEYSGRGQENAVPLLCEEALVDVNYLIKVKESFADNNFGLLSVCDRVFLTASVVGLFLQFFYIHVSRVADYQVIVASRSIEKGEFKAIEAESDIREWYRAARSFTVRLSAVDVD